jgi:hypothetical protein
MGLREKRRGQTQEEFYSARWAHTRQGSDEDLANETSRPPAISRVELCTYALRKCRPPEGQTLLVISAIMRQVIYSLRSQFVVFHVDLVSRILHAPSGTDAKMLLGLQNTVITQNKFQQKNARPESNGRIIPP